MKKLREYMSVSRRGNFPTRYFARPVASILLAILPQFVEKRTTPNRISILAFGLSCIGNVYLLINFDSSSDENITTSLVWFIIQYFAYVLDCADGQFARRSQMISIGGKILDMLLDLAREVVRLFTLIVLFKDETINLLPFLYLFLRIFWISTWAPIDLLIAGKSAPGSYSENEKKVSKGKTLLLSFSTIMQDGFVDILLGFFIIFLLINDLGDTLGFMVFLIICISSVSINIALVFRRVLKND